MIQHINESSFRDPAGFLFDENGKLLRQVNKCYQEDFDFLISSSLYDILTGEGLMIEHKELKNHQGLTPDCYKIIEPDLIGFISYPYEWSFSQLKDAALATLKIQKIALEHDMTLKDSSAYNMQFKNGNPVLIDTLSFEIYQDGKPWQAYRQFCQHFLAPLALMSYTDIRLNQLLKCYLDGIPLDLAAELLPFKTKLKFSLLMHLHLHARTQKKYADKGHASKNIQIKRSNLIALIDSLISVVSGFSLKKQSTEWGEYYTFTNYSDQSFSHKKEIIARVLKNINPEWLWDLGANTGEFTRIAGEQGIQCIAFDIDPVAVEIHYNVVKQQKITNILPLIIDLTNPSPATGWNNKERMSLMQRPRPGAILALALIHHLAISDNLPFNKISGFLSELSDDLVIEFIPKNDFQVRKLLESRIDIFPGYNEENFEKEFSVFFSIVVKERIHGSERILYWMKKKK